MSRTGQVTQVTVKLNAKDEASRNFFAHIENRDRELYPTVFSYLNAAAEALEVSSCDSGTFSFLSDQDFDRIELTVLDALRIYETKKKEERMVP